MKKLKSCKGMSLSNVVLLMLCLILVAFLIYEIVYVDIFDIMDKNKSPVDSISETIGNFIENKAGILKEQTNVEKIEPIINEGYQTSESGVNVSNHYYYNQLDENAKIIYSALENNKENMRSGTYKIDFGTQFNSLLKQSDGEAKLNVAFQSAWNAFTYDYPEIFYIDITKLILTTKTTSIGSFSTHRVELANGENSTYYAEGILSKSDLIYKEEYAKKIRDKIVNNLKGYSNYEQIKYVHNWLIDNLEYDTTYKQTDIHNVYGALVNRKVVCEGYARAFKYILDGLNIENILVSGTATNSNNSTESHAWNYVKLDGKWYAIDVTWDDPIIKGGGRLTDKLRYQNFLKGKDEFLSNHIEDGYLSENSIKFVFPELNSKNYNT